MRKEGGERKTKMKRGYDIQQPEEASPADVQRVLQLLKQYNLIDEHRRFSSLLESANVQLIAKILSHLELRDLAIACRLSKHIRQICEKFHLIDRRFFSNKIWTFNRTDKIWEEQDITLRPGVRQIIGSSDFFLVLYKNSALDVWSRDYSTVPMSWNFERRLTFSPNEQIVSICPILDVNFVSTDIQRIMAVTVSGTVITYNGPFTARFENFPFPNDVKVKSIVSSGNVQWGFRMALTDNGAVYTWGFNQNGVLGRTPDNIDNQANLPRLVEIPNNDRIVQIVCSHDYENAICLALGESGRVYGWGKSRPGMKVREFPQDIGIRSKILSIKFSQREAICLEEDGKTFGIWKPGNYAKVETVGEDVKEIIPHVPYPQHLVLDRNDGFVWKSNFDKDSEGILLPYPVSLYHISEFYIFALTAPYNHFSFPKIEAPCAVCGHAEPENFSYTPQGTHVLLCSQACHQRFFN
jgi:Regulator of chromosome condensation (RCC1) repeat